MNLTAESCLLHAAVLGLSLPLACAWAQAPASGEQGPSVEQRLERVERMLQSQGLLQMLEQLQDLQREIRTLRGEIETQNYQIEQLTRRQRELYTDMDQRLQRLETATAGAGMDPAAAGGDIPPLETLPGTDSMDQPLSTIRSDSPLQVEIIGSPASQQPAGAGRTAESGTGGGEGAITGADQPAAGVAGGAPPAATGPAPAAAAPSAPVDPVQLQAEYQQAFNLLRQSLYDQAIRAFQQFLSAHPNDRFSDNAQYWLAEAYYVQRQYEQALAEYRKVVENFPQSQKVNDAMLKIGFTLFELGRLDEAREQLEALIQKQPDSTVARLAEERIKLIGATRQGQSRTNSGEAGAPGTARPLP